MGGSEIDFNRNEVFSKEIALKPEKTKGLTSTCCGAPWIFSCSQAEERLPVNRMWPFSSRREADYLSRASSPGSSTPPSRYDVGFFSWIAAD